MKNNSLKYYIAAVFFLSTFVMFSYPGEPGPGDGGGGGPGLEGDDGVPIDNYVWVLAVIGLVFVFMKLRAIQKNKIQG
ncbi:hypothetical protein [Flavobacterium sp. WC2509]|uniref:hypothetical protein n=1 Tax=Flavobacterium sp. WC2509 TaxID=3461406 RepID=UPI0040449D1F